MSKHNYHTKQANCKMTEQEFSDLQKINNEFFGGDLNTSDLLRFMIKVATAALDKSQLETKTIRTLHVGNQKLDLT